MKGRTIVNTLIAGSILLILYVFAGHGFVQFHFGGRSEMLEAAKRINTLCNNTRGACPTTLQGWQASRGGNTPLSRGNLLYFVGPGEAGAHRNEGELHRAFRLVYRFTLPDHWYEVRGGVGKPVTAGWESR